jgi:hypothetical protein
MVTEEILQITQLPELAYKDIRTVTLDDLTFNKEEIFNYTTRFSVGDNIKVALQDTFNGITIIAKS